ncbi:MAG: AAA family ATPase, partial [Bryobacteraceae bacterium]
MPVASLTLRNVGPLAEASFEFDSSISVLVGPNNCGKTTVLLALADILLESFTVPAKLISPNCSFHLRLERDQRPEISGTLPFAKETKESSNYREQMESLGYRIFAPAVRLGTDFRSEGPGQRRTAPENVDLVRRLQSGWWDRLQRPALWSDDTRIVQQIVDLDYRSYREKRPAIRNTLDSIAELASAVTEGFPMQFAGIGDDGEGLFPRFKTPDGVVAMDVLSQGTQSLLHWCAQLVIGFAEYYD